MGGGSDPLQDFFVDLTLWPSKKIQTFILIFDCLQICVCCLPVTLIIIKNKIETGSHRLSAYPPNHKTIRSRNQCVNDIGVSVLSRYMKPYDRLTLWSSDLMIVWPYDRPTLRSSDLMIVRPYDRLTLWSSELMIVQWKWRTYDLTLWLSGENAELMIRPYDRPCWWLSCWWLSANPYYSQAYQYMKTRETSYNLVKF